VGIHEGEQHSEEDMERFMKAEQQG